MSTYQKIIELQRLLFSDFKNPGINDEFRKELIKSINQLKAIQKFY